MRKTKIICTLGPATDKDNVLEELILNGMNVARVNFSHGSHEEHLVRVNAVKKLRDKHRLPVAILLDTKGPEIRTCVMPEGGVMLNAGTTVTLTTKDVKGSDTVIPISYPDLPKDLGDKKTILIDDGRVELRVLKIMKDAIECEVLNSGIVSSKKGVNVPGAKLNLPAISEKDKADILFGIENDFDFIAASFVRNGEDVIALRNLLDNNNGSSIGIISKIENSEGVENIDTILHLSDGVMVARGDLGVEVSYEQVPQIQKMIIAKAISLSKPAIIATQMLESMISNPRPTRAEVSDVANAIYDLTTAVMLSGETAAGKYPVECLKVMSKTAEATEGNINYRKRYFTGGFKETNDITNAVTNAAVTTAYNLNADAIIVVTKSGRTAFSIAKYRPAINIIATTPEKKSFHQIGLAWGVYPIHAEEKGTFDDLFHSAMDHSKESGLVKDGDLAVITAGVPVGRSGMTNVMRIETVGDVITRGKKLVEGKAYGKACVCRTEKEGFEKFSDNDVLIIASTDNSILPLMKRASAIILQEDDINDHAKTVGMAIDIPVISNAHGVISMIKDGTMLEVDGNTGVIQIARK
ncbi:MAG: pyruvate kinase [Spirochaetes bacterium]|nr:pyruvate kinase [Spirochaetota bacterium]